MPEIFYPPNDNPNDAEILCEYGKTMYLEYGDQENARNALEIAEKLLTQDGSYRQARGIQAVRQKLQDNQPITSVAYSNLSPRYKR